jgi:hypothetical protein
VIGYHGEVPNTGIYNPLDHDKHTAVMFGPDGKPVATLALPMTKEEWSWAKRYAESKGQISTPVPPVPPGVRVGFYECNEGEGEHPTKHKR